MKNSAITIIAVIIVLAGGGWWWYAHRAQTPVASPGSGTSSSTIATTTAVEYRNTQYGFSVKLPDNWQDYAVKTKQWNGQVYKNGMAMSRDNGPLISINAPTSTNIKQDIPVMVFTLTQWNLVMAGNSGSATTTFMSLGAAPIPPSKLGENSKYVLALPARYNYAFPVGWQEVDKIVQDKTRWSFFEPAK